MAGHAVLQVPVPELEGFVRGRHAHYDPGFVSVDPAFVHAHITALGPFPATLDAGSRELLEAVVAGTPPFEVTLGRIATFPDGIIHLVPEPDQPLRDLTARLVAAFPAWPPYAGAYDEVRPHLTLDRRSTAVSEDSTRAALAALLPVHARVERLDLAWWADGDCRLLESWRLGAV